MADEALIKAIREGNNTALKLFFESFYPSVCIFAGKFLKDTDTARDIAQDAFLEFWNRKEQFADLNGIKKYLYTVTRNKCLNHIRISQIRHEILQNIVLSDDYFYELIQEEETYRVIREAIYKLPVQSRKIVLLTMEGKKNREIADELSVSVNTVKTLKKHAYKELKTRFKDQMLVLLFLKNLL